MPDGSKPGPGRHTSTSHCRREDRARHAFTRDNLPTFACCLLSVWTSRSRKAKKRASTRHEMVCVLMALGAIGQVKKMISEQHALSHHPCIDSFFFQLWKDNPNRDAAPAFWPLTSALPEPCPTMKCLDACNLSPSLPAKPVPPLFNGITSFSRIRLPARTCDLSASPRVCLQQCSQHA